MGYIEKTYGRSEKFLAFKVCFYDTLVPTREYKSGYAADRFACRRARDACRAAMARTMARSRVDTPLSLQRKCVQSMWLSCSLGCWYSGLLYL